MMYLLGCVCIYTYQQPSIQKCVKKRKTKAVLAQKENALKGLTGLARLKAAGHLVATQQSKDSFLTLMMKNNDRLML